MTKEEFEQGFKPCRSQLLSTARRKTNNTEDAEDVMQEVSERAFRNQRTIDLSRGLCGWAYGILMKVLQEYYRRKRKDNAIVSTNATNPKTEGETYEATLADRSPDPYTKFVENDALLRAINTLSPQNRELIVLYAYNGLSYEEISSFLGKPVGTVKGNLNRARKELKKALEAQNNEPTIVADTANTKKLIKKKQG